MTDQQPKNFGKGGFDVQGGEGQLIITYPDGSLFILSARPPLPRISAIPDYTIDEPRDNKTQAQKVFDKIIDFAQGNKDPLIATVAHAYNLIKGATTNNI